MIDKESHSFKKLNSKSFEQLYIAHAKRVYRICFSFVKDPELAKEMTQDIFTSIWERRNNLVIKESYEQYLTKAAKLQVFQHFRKKATQAKFLDQSRENICHHTNCTENQIYYKDLSEEINQIMDRLPCRCREVFEMSRNQGMSNAEIASSLLISVKAVEKHMTKALTVFRKSLKEFNS